MLLCLLLVCALAVPAMATVPDYEITLNPNSAVFPEGSVATYSASADSENMICKWYIRFEGQTYEMTDNTNEYEPWESFAGASYGSYCEDNIFTFYFAGIGAELNGAEIFASFFSPEGQATTRSATILVSGTKMPPTVKVPTRFVVELGAECVLTCTASAPDDSALYYMWMESSDGTMEALTAIDRGTQTQPSYTCDTSTPGMRFYCCLVVTADGGACYSSLIPVVVEPPRILTEQLEEAKQNQPYSFQLEASFPDAEFFIYYNPGKPNQFEETGLTLSKEGLVSGTPTVWGTYTFTVCASGLNGEDYKIYTLSIAHDHVFGQWMVTTPATCTEDGYQVRECDCGAEDFGTIPSPGHAWVETAVIKEPTPIEEGVKSLHCDVCGADTTAPIAATRLLENVTVTKTVPHATGNILYWDSVPYGDVYQIYRLNGSSWELLKNTRSLGYKDETAPGGKTSYYKIVARNGEASSTIATTASTPVTRPSAVTHLDTVIIYKTVGHTTGNILYWNAVDNAKIYQVYRLNGSSWELLKNTGSLAYKDETAPEGVKCYYKIVARHDEVKSDITATASASVTRPSSVTHLDTVTIVSTQGHATGNIIRWNAVENAKLYQVYRLEGGSWVLLKNTGSLAYKDETAAVGVKQYYKIVARNGDVKSDISATSSAWVIRPEA